jgi:catechol 2,3-dioxygenase-like lactoylglutathione lyase family enzyme
MTQIVGIAEAVLYTKDLDRATQFYTEVLGLRLAASFEESRFLQTGSQSTLILFDVRGIKERVSPIPRHGARGEGHVAFAVAATEMDAWRERLLAHGVQIEHEQEWSIKTHSIYFRDPDQNSLELIDANHYRLVWQWLEDGQASERRQPNTDGSK